MVIKVIVDTWQVGVGKILSNLSGHRTDALWRNDVARKLIAHETASAVRARCRWIEYRNLNAGRIHETAEIAANEILRWHGDQTSSLPSPGVKQSQASKEEGLVSSVVDLRQDKRSTNGKSTFVLPEFGFFRLEERTRVQPIVAEMIENAAVELVRSRFDVHVCEPNSESAVLRVERIRNNTEFADHFDEWADFG